MYLPLLGACTKPSAIVEGPLELGIEDATMPLGMSCRSQGGLSLEGLVILTCYANSLIIINGSNAPALVSDNLLTLTPTWYDLV